MQLKRPESLSQMAEEQIRLGIVRGEFQLGESLQENRLSESLGISKTPIREALAALGRQGLVRFFPNRGAFVFTLNQTDTQQLCHYRLMLESKALELARSLNLEELITALEDICDLMSTAVKQDDFDGYLELDDRFHDTFFDLCGNKYLRDGYHQISAVVATMRTQLSKRSDRIDKSFGEHKAILEHLRTGDLASAMRVLERQVTRGERFYIDLVGKNQEPPAAPSSERS